MGGPQRSSLCPGLDLPARLAAARDAREAAETFFDPPTRETTIPAVKPAKGADDGREQ